MNKWLGSSAIGLLLLLSLGAHAQLEFGTGIGNALPITGYRQVLKNGWLVTAEAKHRLRNENFAIGAEVHFARLQKDRKSSDAFQNARMIIVPLIFSAEYETNYRGILRPFVSAGIGISLFNLNYDTSPALGNSLTNVSFTMSPQAGIRYALSKNLVPFFKASMVLIADGPPQGFPKGEKLTGYNAFLIGLNYNLNQ